MISNEDLYLESFIYESDSLSDEQILERFNKLSESCQKRLVEAFKGKALSKESYKEVYDKVNKLINELEFQIEEITDRAKNAELIGKFKSNLDRAKGIKALLEKDIVREKVQLPPILKSNIIDAKSKENN